MPTERSVVESSSVRLDADKIELSISTKEIVTVSITAYGDWSTESQSVMASKLSKGIEVYREEGKKLRDAFVSINGHVA